MAQKILTTDHGVPVAYNQNSLTAAERGLAFRQDIPQIEKQEMMV
jgi:catalase